MSVSHIRSVRLLQVIKLIEDVFDDIDYFSPTGRKRLFRAVHKGMNSYEFIRRSAYASHHEFRNGEFLK